MSSRVIGRLPSPDERYHVKHIVLGLQNTESDGPRITEQTLAETLSECMQLESVCLSGAASATSDMTIVTLADTANNTLQGVDISGCRQVSDIGVLDLVSKGCPLQWIHLNGVVGLTDPSISSIAKACAQITELELADLPLITALSVRDIWSYSRKLRTLRLARCNLLTDKAFPGSSHSSSIVLGKDPDRPLIATWLDDLTPLILRHRATDLRILDLAHCTKLSDDACIGILEHAPNLQTLLLSGCSRLTNRSLEGMSTLGRHLVTLAMAHIPQITDAGVIVLARSCEALSSVDFSFCRNLTDLSIFELAALKGLRRLSAVRLHQMTDNAIHYLSEHAFNLQRLHISYCDNISVEAIHLLLNKVDLHHLTVTGVPAFTTRKGVNRFSEIPPATMDPGMQKVYRVYSGDNVTALRTYLNKEEKRRRDCETSHIPFKPRSDDKVDLY